MASRIVGRADSSISELIECSGEWKEGSRAARRTLSSGMLVGGVAIWLLSDEEDIFVLI